MMAPREREDELQRDIALLFQDVRELQLCGTKETRPSDKGKVTLSKRMVFGYICSFGVVFCMVGGTCCVQALGDVVPPFELGTLRYLCQLTVTFPLAVFNGFSLIPPRRPLPWLLLSCLSSSAYNLLFFTASVYLPIGTMGGIEQSLVLIFVAVIGSIMVLDCKLHITAAVILCVTGVILVSQPEFLFQGIIEAVPRTYSPICFKGEHSSADNTSYMDAIIFIPEVTIPAGHFDNTTDAETGMLSGEIFGYILTSSAAVVTAATYFIISRTLTDISPFVTSFWLSVTGIFLNGVPMLIFEEPGLPTSWKCWLLMVGHTYMAALASLFTSISMVIVPTIQGALIYCLQVFGFFVAQYTFMKSINPGKHNAVEIVGAVVILVGSCVNPVYQFYLRTQKQKEEVERTRLLSDESDCSD